MISGDLWLMFIREIMSGKCRVDKQPRFIYFAPNEPFLLIDTEQQQGLNSTLGLAFGFFSAVQRKRWTLPSWALVPSILWPPSLHFTTPFWWRRFTSAATINWSRLSWLLPATWGDKITALHCNPIHFLLSREIHFLIHYLYYWAECHLLLVSLIELCTGNEQETWSTWHWLDGKSNYRKLFTRRMHRVTNKTKAGDNWISLHYLCRIMFLPCSNCVFPWCDSVSLLCVRDDWLTVTPWKPHG